MPDDGCTTAASEPRKASKHMRPSDSRISDALQRMRHVHDTAAYKKAPEACVAGLLNFMDEVDPDLLSKDETDFVAGFMAVIFEHMDKTAKGGA